ncbi:MAG: DUF4474 domain-containing protein [Oscillospiraceae bacterium]|jgi:hypothetical protein|nr:DUF4474 domain-containing protein [Oscillospiraceae bacterium]
MSAILSILIYPFLLLVNLLFPAQGAAAVAQGSLDAIPAPALRMQFEMPPRDDPFFEDLPFVHAYERTALPQVDWEQIQARMDADETAEAKDWFRFLGDELIQSDFQLILSNYPRVALVYDAQTGDFKGITDEGVLHLGFSYNIKSSFFYATKNPWMRVVGFNEFYDWLGDDFFGMFQLLTRRVRFAYDGRDYQVQLWKGKYFLDTCMGAEIGFYYKPQSRTQQHYDALPLAEMMPMTMKLYSNRDLYFDLPAEDHWWDVMMVHRVPRVNPHAVTLEGSVDFAKNPGLGEAFFAALQEQYPDVTPTQEGNVVWFCWQATETVE